MSEQWDNYRNETEEERDFIDDPHEGDAPGGPPPDDHPKDHSKDDKDHDSKDE